MSDYLYFLGELLVNFMYVFLFIRLMGKKELNQATPLDFGYMVILTSIAWDMTLESQYNLIHSFIAMSLISAVIALIDWITYKYQVIDNIFLGKPKTVIENGKMDREILKDQRLSENELNMMLREKGIFDINHVEIAILEIDGKLSIKKEEDKQ